MDLQPRISEDQMYQALDQAFAGDSEQSLVWQLSQKVTDPLNPETDSGRRRINPLLIALIALALIVIATFLYFGIFQHE
jgi:hypothetical protein